MGYQKTIIEGNLGKPVELRQTPAGKSVGNFPVAVDEGFGDKKNTTWFDVTAWEKTAEACSNYLGKGSKVLVEGRIQTRSYDDKDGIKRYSWSLIASRVEFLDSKGQQEQPSGGGGEPTFDPEDGIPF